MIFLKEIWSIEKLDDYKVHFARWNGDSQPLEVFVRDKTDWQGWQEHRPARNDFNRPFIFSLAQFYHESDAWLFCGVYRVVKRYKHRYEVELLDLGSGFIGRLKLYSDYRGRTTRVNLENHYDSFAVREILREPYSGRQFPGYDDIDLSFEELETLVKNDRQDWKAALENIKGIYPSAIRKLENATSALHTAIKESGRVGLPMSPADMAAMSNCVPWLTIRPWITADPISVSLYWSIAQPVHRMTRYSLARLSGNGYCSRAGSRV